MDVSGQPAAFIVSVEGKGFNLTLTYTSRKFGPWFLKVSRPRWMQWVWLS